MPITSPIPMPENGMDAFLKGMAGSQEMFKALSQNRLNQAQGQHLANLDTAIPYDIQQTQANTQKQNILNQYLPEREQTEIQKEKQMGDYYSSGGAGMGVGGKSELEFQHYVSLDNPDLKTAEDRYTAANQLKAGKTTMPDGRPINFSPTAQDALSRLTMKNQPAAITAQNMKANAAAVETPPIDNFIKEQVKNYGTTIYGWSPKLTKDMLNTKDPEAQKRVGNYVAAQMLQYDKSALMTRMMGSESGVTILQDMNEKTQNILKNKYPLLTAEARQIAIDSNSAVVKEMLRNRNKYMSKGARSLRDPNAGEAEIVDEVGTGYDTTNPNAPLNPVTKTPTKLSKDYVTEENIQETMRVNKLSREEALRRIKQQSWYKD